MLTRVSLVLTAVLLASPLAEAGSCLARPADAIDSDAYTVVAGWPPEDMQLLVNEFAFRHDWHKHSDAFAQGFGRGDEVYGESLTLGGEFDQRRVDAWKRSYIKKHQVDYLKRLAPHVGKLRIDRELVAALLSSCLRRGVWAVVEPMDDCQFKFSAGLWPEQRRKADALPVRFGVSGGRCEPWPNQPLTSAETAVSCVRSGNGGTKVTLELADGTVVGKTLAPLVARRLPDEPLLENRSASKAPEIEVITLFRSRDYRQVQPGRGCPTCRLLAADVRPSQAGAMIVDIGVVSSTNSGHWFRCPAGLRCAVPEFSPTDQRNVSGQQACRVWRLTDDDAEAQDAIQITYQAQTESCKNCPQGMDYLAAHKSWEEAKERAQKGCEDFADLPVQVMQKRRRP